jgi:hypothetical protein
MSFCWESGEEAPVPDQDMEAVYSICFTNYPPVLRQTLEQNANFWRCDVQARNGGHPRDQRGTDVICSANQLEAILSGLKRSQHQHNVIVTETFRYWIFGVLRHLRSLHVGLNETFLFSVPQSDAFRAQSASEGLRCK